MREKDCQQLAEHYLDLYSIAYALLNNPTDTEDAVQEALTRTMSQIWLKEPYTYCCRVLKNYCYETLRQKNRLLLGGVPDQAIEENPPNNDQLYDQLEQLTDNLPEETRMLLNLHYEEGYTMPAIAEKTGLTISQVKKRFSKIHIYLKKELLKLNPQRIKPE